MKKIYFDQFWLKYFKLWLQQAREQMMRQSSQNEQMHGVSNTDTFINQYASGPQQSAGFSTNGGQIRNMNNYQNSYRNADLEF